jgi:nitroimidazol reductase NimA-like FMN-containing flavoprotein (pyridoxamine 5'-phosphate oxidase superfamily)
MLAELNESEIRDIIKDNSTGRLGYTDGVNVYVIPMNYRYNENFITCYSLEGKKIDIMRNNRSVCFEIDQITNSNHWKCVVINGLFEEITNEYELAQLRPLYTEYALRKRSSLPDDSNILKPTDLMEEPRSKQVFYKIIYDVVSGRSQDGLI